jgi:hypothetical protein
MSFSMFNWYMHVQIKTDIIYVLLDVEAKYISSSDAAI